MGTDKTHINYPINVIYPYHQSILVSGNIEYDSTIFKDTGITKVSFYFIGRRPVSL